MEELTPQNNQGIYEESDHGDYMSQNESEHNLLREYECEVVLHPSDSVNSISSTDKKPSPNQSESSLRLKNHSPKNKSKYPDKSTSPDKPRSPEKPRSPDNSRSPDKPKRPPSPAESKVQIYAMDDLAPNSFNDQTPKEENPSETEDPQTCSIYITNCHDRDPIRAGALKKHISNLLTGKVNIHETSCGLVVQFTNENDLDRVLKVKMAVVFGRPVVIWQLSNVLKPYRRVVACKDIPWCVPIVDVQNALHMQGIKAGKVQRVSGIVNIELRNANDLDRLLQEGLSFYNSAYFPVTLELAQHPHEEQEIIQCYRCQRFWHTASHCRYSPRCVRCGENHEVSSCEKSRYSARCCLCGGPHHAAHKMCPVRLQHINSLQVELSLSKKPTFLKGFYDN